MDEDPVYAKQLLRVDRFRDALQRRHGMSGDQILELDKGITEEGILARKDLYKALIQKGYAPEGGFKTELGTMERAPESQIGRHKINKAGLPYDSTTGKIDVTATGQMFDALKANIAKNMPNLSEEEQYLMAIGLANKDNRIDRFKTTILQGGRGLYIEDTVTHRGRVIKTNLGEKPNWVNEVYNSTNIPGNVDGVVLFNKSAPNASDTGIIMRFKDMPLATGGTVQTEIDALLAREGNTPETKSKIMQMINKFTGFFTFDHSPAMDYAQTGQIKGAGGQAVGQRVVGGERPGPQPVGPAPNVIQKSAGAKKKEADVVEIKKTNDFFLNLNK
jgi:hypothetical protein